MVLFTLSVLSLPHQLVKPMTHVIE